MQQISKFLQIDKLDARDANRYYEELFKICEEDIQSDSKSSYSSSADDREETFQFKESPYAKISKEMNKSYKISREEIHKIMQDRMVVAPNAQTFHID